MEKGQKKQHEHEQEQKQEQKQRQEQKQDHRPHKNLLAWQRSMDLVVALYEITRSFPRDEAFGLVSQIRRAAVSVPSNIAEGMTRRWPKERTHFLNISQASLSELDTQLELTRRLGYTPSDTCNQLTERMSEIQRLLGGLVRSIRE